MTIRKEISKLMKKHGFELIRSNKHLIWEHKTIGKKISTSSTPSCPYALLKIKKDINNVLAFGA